MKSTSLKIISIAALLVTTAGATFRNTGGAILDKPEEKKAFELLNKIRENPGSYNKRFGVNLNSVKPKPDLKWNDTLTKAAEAKALDMATRHYFNHVNPDGYGMNYYINKAGYELDAYMLTDKKANFFESIDAGADSGTNAIKDLIIDKETPGLGHRVHLLGMNDFYANLTDIGIGFARCSDGCTYSTYMSVIIAKHHL